jgi:N-acetylglutamate synthase-like GNAT family acetyltransferase
MEVHKLKKQGTEDFINLFKTILEESFEYRSKKNKEKILRNWTQEKITKRLERNDYLMIVAEANSQMFGYLAAIIKGDISFVRWMGVKEGFQGRGVGGKLVKFWENWAKKGGVKSLRISTYLAKNVSIFQKLGFEKRGADKTRYGKRYKLIKEI